MTATAAEKLRTKLGKLFAMLGSANVNEREIARTKIDELLAKNKKTWNDLRELMSGGSAQGWRDDDDADDAGVAEQPTDQPRRPAPLDLIHRIFERHLHLTEHQLVAVTLWTAHTFVFQKFSITPRLVVTSPTRGCGKTRLLEIVQGLGFRAEITDNTTAAVLFREIDRDRGTALIDEGDNQDLAHDKTLCSVINAGYRAGKVIKRWISGEVAKFQVFAPLAFATIGTHLPLPTLHRSIIIRMERSPIELLRFDPKLFPNQQADLDIVYRETLLWSNQVVLDFDPPLPKELVNRPADNWRPLISIADACNDAWGAAAREAAIALSAHQDEDLGVLLLADIRDVFDRRPSVDRLASATIVDELNDMPDSLWAEWRGPRDDQAPRRLSQGQLATMLKPFDIRPKSIWPSHRGASDKSAKGYLRVQFEAAWASYCDGAGTPSQRSNVSYLNSQAL
jgi:hypothetical protein